MKTYTVLYAEDVPHYATVEIEADNDQDATERAKAHDFGNAPLEAEWNNAVCRRIVHIEDATGNTVRNDISLDNTLLLTGSEVRDAIQYALECLGNFRVDWLANHGLTVVVERLELAYAEVGGTPWPLEKKAPRTHSSHGTLSNSPPPELLTDSVDAPLKVVNGTAVLICRTNGLKDSL